MAHSSVTQSPGGISFGEEPRARSPRRKSIQFNVGAAEAQLPSRSLSFKDKRRSQGDNTPIRDVEVEREQRPLSVSRGLSPPPPKYVFNVSKSFLIFPFHHPSTFSYFISSGGVERVC